MPLTAPDYVQRSRTFWGNAMTEATHPQSFAPQLS